MLKGGASEAKSIHSIIREKQKAPLANIGFEADDLAKLFALIKKEKSIALAVSGGKDSLALMVLVCQWLEGNFTEKNSPEVFIYSVDHGLRAEAANECELVKKLALEFGFSHKTLIWSGEKPMTGLQAAARKARYALLGKQMLKDGVKTLLTGHHLDDQGETVLMRLTHGSGIGGLSAMAAFSNVEGTRIFRPLLSLRSKQLALIVKKSGLEAVDDPSNEDQKYERVRWRKFLQTSGEIGLSAPVLAKFANRMERADTALEHFANEQYKNIVFRDKFSVQWSDLDKLASQPEEIGIRLLEKMIFIGSGGRGFGELSKREKLYERLFVDGFTGEVIAGCAIVLWRGKLVVFREFSRVVSTQTRLKPEEEIIWDQRFIIKNLGQGPLKVGPAKDLSRQQLFQLIPDQGQIKMDWIRSAPLVVDEAGEVLAIGAFRFSKALKCYLLD